MSIELLPVGNKCSLSCKYCYQQPMRDAGNFAPKKDYNAVLARLENVDSAFTLFGGEPLLTPLPELEEYFKIGLRRFGKNGIQTSLSFIREEHFDLFARYKVHVGVSMDGPGYLNSPRCDISVTNRIYFNLCKLLMEGNEVSLICTLHSQNATESRLPELLVWFKELDGMGLKSCRLHLLEVDKSEAEYLRLTELEAFDALIALYKLDVKIQFDMLPEMKRLLMGDMKDSTCIWNGCDPYTTPAVQGILPDGSMANCGRTNKDGIDWQKSERTGNERLLALYHTPQEYGGCRDCQYFFACRGECPGQSSDWRERTEHCSLLKRIFAYLEKELESEGKHPISKRGDNYDFNKMTAYPNHHGDSIRVPVRS